MSNDNLVYIYIYMFVISFFAFVEEYDLSGIFVAMIVALLWPISIPARILRQIIS